MAIRKVARPIERAAMTIFTLRKAKVTPTAIASILVPMAVIIMVDKLLFGAAVLSSVVSRLS